MVQKYTLVSQFMICRIKVKLYLLNSKSVADPGFPVGGRGPRGGAWQLCFENFVCQNERIWTLGGGP